MPKIENNTIGITSILISRKKASAPMEKMLMIFVPKELTKSGFSETGIHPGTRTQEIRENGKRNGRGGGKPENKGI